MASLMDSITCRLQIENRPFSFDDILGAEGWGIGPHARQSIAVSKTAPSAS